MTVKRDKYQPLVAVIVFDGCLHARIESEKFVIWFTVDIICFAFATPLIY